MILRCAENENSVDEGSDGARDEPLPEKKKRRTEADKLADAIASGQAAATGEG